jgi:hypothetical protein
MRLKKKNRIAILTIAALVSVGAAACVKPFTPTVVSSSNNYLVVEGLINISDSTYIKLSRTVNVYTATTVKPELKATVTIESNTGASYLLTELGNGLYSAPNYNLSAANQYRVRVKTSTGSTYLSDFAATKVSPAIDSLTWAVNNNQLQIFNNTHDPNNATHYYRWSFTEEWLFHTDFNSNITTDGLNVRYRLPSESVFQCFGGDVSTSIGLGTSVQLSSDVIRRAPVTSLASTDPKIGIRYSIQLSQYALTPDAYTYWTLLKTNTENLGSIFDAQPSASIGNIHNIANAAEPVIGYVSAGTVSKLRIFIDKSQLPKSWIATFNPPLTDCGPDSLNCCAPPNAAPGYMPPTTNQYVNYKNVSTYIGGKTPLIPIEVVKVTPPSVLTNTTPITAALPSCVDCTTMGTTAQPAYWH